MYKCVLFDKAIDMVSFLNGEDLDPRQIIALEYQNVSNQWVLIYVVYH